MTVTPQCNTVQVHQSLQGTQNANLTTPVTARRIWRIFIKRSETQISLTQTLRSHIFFTTCKYEHAYNLVSKWLLNLTKGTVSMKTIVIFTSFCFIDHLPSDIPFSCGITGIRTEDLYISVSMETTTARCEVRVRALRKKLAVCSRIYC